MKSLSEVQNLKLSKKKMNYSVKKYLYYIK